MLCLISEYLCSQPNPQSEKLAGTGLDKTLKIRPHRQGICEVQLFSPCSFSQIFPYSKTHIGRHPPTTRRRNRKRVGQKLGRNRWNLKATTALAKINSSDSWAAKNGLPAAAHRQHPVPLPWPQKAKLSPKSRLPQRAHGRRNSCPAISSCA